MRANANKKKAVNYIAIITAVVLATYAITMIVPILWTLMTTVKKPLEYGAGENVLWFPKLGLTFDNFVTAFKYFKVTVEPTEYGQSPVSYNILLQFVNSILYSVGCSAAVTLTSLVMGYATARFNYAFSKVIYAFVLIAIALPIVGSMPSEIQVANTLGIFDTFPGIWIMRATFLNTYFLIFHANFKAIPKDYTEAAKIDGASPFTIMFQIIVPLAVSTIVTIFVLNFIAYWNDFQIPMVYIPSYPVAALGMYRFQNARIYEIDNDPTRLAGICLMALPIVIFYAIFNKQLNVNMSDGGIKG